MNTTLVFVDGYYDVCFKVAVTNLLELAGVSTLSPALTQLTNGELPVSTAS